MVKLHKNANVEHPQGKGNLKELLVAFQAANPDHRIVCSKEHPGRFSPKIFHDKSQHGNIYIVTKTNASGRSGLHLHCHKDGITLAAHQLGRDKISGAVFHGSGGYALPQHCATLQGILTDPKKISKHFGKEALQDGTPESNILELWRDILELLQLNMKAPPSCGKAAKAHSPLKPKLNFGGGGNSKLPPPNPQQQAEYKAWQKVQENESRRPKVKDTTNWTKNPHRRYLNK